MVAVYSSSPRPAVGFGHYGSTFCCEKLRMLSPQGLVVAIPRIGTLKDRNKELLK
jgi:hypothetical protein